jgi:hypothetical protein
MLITWTDRFTAEMSERLTVISRVLGIGVLVHGGTADTSDARHVTRWTIQA